MVDLGWGVLLVLVWWWDLLRCHHASSAVSLILLPSFICNLLLVELIVLLFNNLADHTRRSAQENDMRDAVHDSCDFTARFHKYGDCVANTSEALHAVVEADELNVGGIRNQVVFNHQVDPGSRDGESRAAQALQAGTTATPVAGAANKAVTTVLTARCEALAATIL